MDRLPSREAMQFVGGKWHSGHVVDPPSQARFADFAFWYANLIDYARVAMCLLAAVTLWQGWALVTALLLLGSTLLDWVDGPVARRYNQCTLFGSGIDWLADVLAQVVTVIWLARLEPAWQPLLVLALTVELGNCVFDYATSTSPTYPVMGPQRGFGLILQWSMPGGSYNWLGTGLWLAYPVFLLARCLELDWAPAGSLTAQLLHGTALVLALPAVAYVWCEAAYWAFILGQWREPRRDAPARMRPAAEIDEGEGGFLLMGRVEAGERQLLERSFAEVTTLLADRFAQRLANREVFWLNVWQAAGDHRAADFAELPALRKLAEQLAVECFADQDFEVDGMGFITNPVGSVAQDWHLDYHADYATVFVPLTPVTPKNATQFALIDPRTPQATVGRALADPDRVDIDALVESGVNVSVRQLLGPPFSVLRMDFGCIHRGIANTGSYDRHMFYVSVRRNGLAPIGEDSLVDFAKAAA